MKINRFSAVGALAGVVLLAGGAPAQADPLLDLIDNLNISDLNVSRVLSNPAVVVTNGGSTTLSQAEPLLAPLAAPAAAPAAPAAAPAAPAAPVAAPAAPKRTVQAAPVLPGGAARIDIAP
ncbi:hypothetical protein ACIGFK_32305 [Streptomyces sp. NPDC085524]|uniref:hypothetical protein n=1 Tax=unclassified Streptomyces TaxID=2593676 RepID=UPI0035D7D664